MNKALEDIVVVDLTRFAAGPFCTMNFADLGAKVIKIEHKNSADASRGFIPFLGEGEDEISGYYCQYNRGKKGISLDLYSEEGKAILRRLLAKADILVENYRAGIMNKMGLGYEEIHKEFPKLVYVSISGYGQYGPYTTRPCFDNCAQALSGLWAANGYPDRPPVRVGTIIGDLSASLFGTIGALAALHYAQETGVGQWVDVAQLDSTLAMTETMVVNYLTGGVVTKPMGNDHPFVMPYSLFECKDGYIYDGGYTDKFWQAQCEFFGEPEYAKDPRVDTMVKRHVRETYDAYVKPKLVEWIKNYTMDELMEGLGDKIPMAPIKDMPEVVKDPQILARDMIQHIDYPQGDVGIFGSPIKLSETPAETRIKAPVVIGCDNEEIYLDWLGMSKEEYENYKASGVI